RILDRVIERNLLQPVETLAGGKFFEIQRHGGIPVERSKTAGRPFEMQRYVGINGAALPDRHPRDRTPSAAAAPVELSQERQSSAGDFNLNPQHVEIRKNLVAGRRFLNSTEPS